MVATVKRIRRPITEDLNQQRQRETEARLAYYAAHPQEIEQRLSELDREWDIDRAVEMKAAGMVLTGFVLGTVFGRKWFLLPLGASVLLLLCNVRGSYPLLPLFRSLGLRTAREIDQERYALKALRGDFAAVRQGNGQERTRTAFEAASPSGRSAPSNSGAA